MSRARVHNIIIGVLLMTLLFTGCEEPVGKEPMELTIDFSLPAEALLSSNQAPQRRVLGDPGSEEILDFPNYIYIFVAFDLTNNRHQVKTVSVTLTDSDWKEEKFYNESNTSLLEHIYRCTKRVIVLSPAQEDRSAGRVYIAASSKPLTLIPEDPSSEDAIKNIKFTVTPELQISGLQNIYSTPCKLNRKLSDNSEVYYGTITNFTTELPYANVQLYHVASKVDIMWNVPSNKQDELCVTGVRVNKLFNGDSYLFKPTENLFSALVSNGGTRELSSGEVGKLWAGREYFYSIPYQSEAGKQTLYVDFEIKSLKADGTPTYLYSVAKTQSMPAVFSPWIRGQYSFSTPLTKNETHNE